jgi:hypothetical protein
LIPGASADSTTFPATAAPIRRAVISTSGNSGMDIQRSSVRNMPRTLLVLGARNLGGAIADHFKDIGWNTAAVALSEETVATAAQRGHHGMRADAADPDAIANACDQTSTRSSTRSRSRAARPARSAAAR